MTSSRWRLKIKPTLWPSCLRVPTRRRSQTTRWSSWTLTRYISCFLMVMIDLLLMLVKLEFLWPPVLITSLRADLRCNKAKIPGQDAILGHFVFGSSELMIIQYIYSQIVILGESKPDKIPGHSWLSFFAQTLLNLSLLYRTFPTDIPILLSHFVATHVYALLYWAFALRSTHNLVAFCRERRLRVEFRSFFLAFPHFYCWILSLQTFTRFL